MSYRVLTRLLRSQRAITLLNLGGLALAFLTVTVIALFVQDELTYDRFHSKSDRIYRFVTDKLSAEGVLETAVSPSPAAAALVEDFPEVLAAARITSYGGFFAPKAVVRVGSESYLEENVLFTDPSVFEVFDLPLAAGDPDRALSEAGSAIVSESLAAIWFGSENPIGRVITVANIGELTIAGVFAEIPPNSHVKTRLFVSFETFRRALLGSPLEPLLDSWTPLFYWTYLVLAEDASGEALAAKLEDFLVRHVGPDGPQRFAYRLQRLGDLHFHSRRMLELEEATDPGYVTIPVAVGVLLLLVAAINFMNLATARAAQRGKEVGVRKMLGAERRGLILQFLGEALAQSLAALLIALAAFHLLRPSLAALSGKALRLEFVDDWPMIALLLGVALVTGLLAGLYPAFVLAGFRPAEALGSRLTSGGPLALLLRRALVVLQLAVGVVLIAGSLGASLQLAFLQDDKLGLNDQVVVVPLAVEELAGREGALRDAIAARPEVAAAGLASAIPGGIIAGRTYSPEGLVGTQDVSFRLFAVSPELSATLQLELQAGRDFDRRLDGADGDALLINEAAVAALGWEDPLDRRLEKHPRPNEDPHIGRVVGVVGDFQFSPLKAAISPTLLYLTSEPLPYLYVRLAGNDAGGALAALESEWDRLVEATPFDYFFLEERYAEMYRAERTMGDALVAFTAVAVAIGVLGLAGLAAFVAELRTKEIGIRKLLGDSLAGILALLGREFVVMNVLANLLAWPLALLALRRWLEGFAYQVPLPWWLLPAAGLAVMAVSLLTVALLSLRAASAHPVRALRYE